MTYSFPPKRKKKKFSNNCQIVAGLPEGRLVRWVLGAGHQLAHGYSVPNWFLHSRVISE